MKEGVSIYILFGIILWGIFVSSPHLFIYPIFYLYQYGLNVYLLYSWIIIYNNIIYFVFRILPAFAFGISFMLASMSLWHVPQFCFLKQFLAFWYFVEPDAPGSAYIFPVSGLESAISLRSPGFPYCRMIFRNQDVGSECAHCYWISLLFGSLSQQS